MDNFINLAYQKRDPISIGASFLLALGLFLTLSFHHNPKKNDITETDFVAMLDTPASTTVQAIKELVRTEKKELAPPKVEPKKTQLEKSHEHSIENNTSNPTQNNTNNSKSESSNNQATSKSSEVATLPSKTVTVSQASSVKYENYVLAYLEKNKKYPTSRQARESRPEGTVKVYLDLNRLGQVVGYGVLQSSGSNLLDSEAIKVIKFAALPPFPDESFVGEQTHRFIANLKYSIVNNGYQNSTEESN